MATPGVAGMLRRSGGGWSAGPSGQHAPSRHTGFGPLRQGAGPQRNRGVQVRTWSASDLNEIYGLRSLLEPHGSRLAAATGKADCAALDQLCDGMESAVNARNPDLDRVAELNNELHRAIIEASGNSRLTGLVTANLQIPLVRHTFSRYSEKSLQRSMAHHRELVDALRAGDPEWAESVMRSHVHAAWSVMRDYFDTAGEGSGTSVG